MAPASKKRLLVVCAHPDDEVLGCGGSVALRIQQGWECRLLVMTQGIDGRRKAGEKISSKIKLQQIKLAKELKAASKVLGFSKVKQLEFPDNRMDTVSRMDVAHSIRQELIEFKPQVVLTHHFGDYNWDHRVTFEAVMMAARTSPGDPSPSEIYSFEVLSSTERAFQTAATAFCPNVFVGLDHQAMTKKKKALLCYQTEKRVYPHPRSVEGIDILAKKRGLEVALPYAEAFELIRKVES